MSREIMLRYTCNFCGAERYSPADRPPPADFASFQISAGEGTKVDALPKPRGFDACKECIEAEPLSTILKVAYPLAAAKTAKAPAVVEADGGSESCPDCGEVFTHSGMGLHRSKAHGFTTPHAAKAEARGHGPLKCPECKFGAGNPQGLAAHRRSVHGVTALRVDKPKGTVACEEPGCDWTGTSGQGLGVHRLHTHGIRSARARKKK